MSTYLEVLVPIQSKDKWFKNVREEVKKVAPNKKVDWQELKKLEKQKKPYHLTVAYILDNPLRLNLRPVFDEFLKDFEPISITFDKLDVLSSNKKDKDVIYLTSSQIPKAFKDFVGKIRKRLIEKGCDVSYYKKADRPGLADEDNFLFHVSLGTMSPRNVDDEMRQKFRSIPVGNGANDEGSVTYFLTTWNFNKLSGLIDSWPKKRLKRH